MNQLKPTVDLGYPTEPHGRVPSFNNIEEEAEFWDTHDLTGFDAEFGTFRIMNDQVLTDTLIVRLEPETWQTLSKIARERDVGPSTLAQTWLEERLGEEAALGEGSR